MANTDDMRYVRTESAIRAAFMSIVAEKPVTSVTVSELCRRAGISRNAFYLHYSGVSALYATFVDELVSEIRAAGMASSKRRETTGSDDDLSADIVRALARREEMLRALLPSDDGSLVKWLAEGIEEAFVEAALYFGPHGASLEHRLRCAYAAWGVIGLVSRWIDGTTRPIAEALPLYDEMQASVIEASAKFLMDDSREADG